MTEILQQVTFVWNRMLKHFLGGKKSSYKCLNISFTVTEHCAHINICSYLGRFPLGKVRPYPSNGSQPAPQCVESCWKSSSLCTCSGYTAHIWSAEKPMVQKFRKKESHYVSLVVKVHEYPHNMIVKRKIIRFIIAVFKSLGPCIAVRVL